jgi:hypothetical protein
LHLASSGFAALTVFTLCASGFADELECPPGARLRVDDGSRGRAEMCVDDAGNLDGPARMYLGDVLRREDSWQGGVQHGRAIVYDELGVNREERFYRAGQVHGIETHFHANGVRRTVTTYDEGEKQGRIAEWDDAGRPLVAGYFFAGEPDGLWHFSPPGEAPYVRVFEAGAAVTPIAASEGCVAWSKASAGQQELLAATLLLQSVAELDLDATTPNAQLARYRLHACALGDPMSVERAIAASCAAKEPLLLGAQTSDTLAAAIADCFVQLIRE